MQRLAKYFLVGLVCPNAWAGPPFVTDDPEPVDDGHWEFNNAVILNRAAGVNSGYLPQIDGNYGAGENLQLHFQPQEAFYAGPHHSYYGLGDTELGVKYRFASHMEGEDGWMIALYPLFEVPTGNVQQNLGTGQLREFLPVWFQDNHGPWTIYGGGGYWYNGGGGWANAWQAGVVVLYQFTPTLQLGGEYNMITSSLASNLAGLPGATGFNLGGAWLFSQHYHLLFSGGKGLTNVTLTNQASAYLAIQVVF